LGHNLKAAIHTEQINGQPTDKNRHIRVTEARFSTGNILTYSGQSILADHLELSAKKLPFDQILVIRSWLTWAVYAKYKSESHNRAQPAKKNCAEERTGTAVYRQTGECRKIENTENNASNNGFDEGYLN
jgi:hypothetical protein